ncbi:MAG: FecR domain-containing protein [Prosthecobacter sp.]|uniref:FecR domain-containing protein n=1 Tax=Prosthecobacter sp. TaxID=1965333 RepID=UPI003900A347
MKLAPLRILATVSLWCAYGSSSACGQAPVVAKVTQALSLASSGTVQRVSQPGAASGPGKTAAPEIREIVTGPDGSDAMLLGTLGAARLEANSAIRMPDAKSTHSLEMLKGRLFLNIDAAEIKKRQNSEFRLKTPAALLAVKGTKFFVVSENGRDTVGAHEGAVAVLSGNGGTPLLLKAGQAVTIIQGQVPAARAMSQQELADASLYDKISLVESPLALSGSDAPGSILRYFLRGDLTTLQDQSDMAKIGPLVVCTPDRMGTAQLELSNDGVLRLKAGSMSVVAPGVLKMAIYNLLQPEDVIAIRFQIRVAKELMVSSNGDKWIDSKNNASKRGPTEWNECALLLNRVSGRNEQMSASLVFDTEDQKAPRRAAKGKGDILVEMRDFILLSRKK